MHAQTDAQPLTPNVFRVPFAVGQVYFWVRDAGPTRIDSDLPGAAQAIGTSHGEPIVGQAANALRALAARL